MKRFVGDKTRSSKRKSAREQLLDQDDEEDILNQMLLDVPEQVLPEPKRVRRPQKQEKKIERKNESSEEEWDDDIYIPPPEERKIEDLFDQMLTQETVEKVERVPVVGEARSFYWYDSHEDPYKYPGVVYLFGKVPSSIKSKYDSCCAIIKNIKRTCYLLIASDSNYDEAVGEFTHIIAKKHKISDFTCEKVTKKYAFSDSNIPAVADYIKLEYPCNQTILPANLKGETFTHVLNSNQTPMERLILDLKLRGPCWLKLNNAIEPTGAKLTHTRLELIIDSPNNVEVEEQQPEAPYFCAIALSLRTFSHANEIIAIAGMMNTCLKFDECLNRKNKASGHFILMAKPSAAHKTLRLPYDFQASMKKYNKSRFELFDNERDLLIAFLDKFTNLDPDIVIGHELVSCDYETMVARMKINKVPGWSQLGRFHRTDYPATKMAFKNMFSGRIICDIETSAKELIHLRSYDLVELTNQILGVTLVEYTHETIAEAYKFSDSLIRLLNATWDNADYIFSILAELNVIPLALKITNITGGVLSRTLSGGRSERNDYLLLHAFHEDGHICPERQAIFNPKLDRKNALHNKGDNVAVELAPKRKKAAYAGGLVLEPKVGYYDTCILLMDFNSLYPSIIQEFNICFTTVKVPEQVPGDENAEIIASVPSESAEVGILPIQLKKLVDGRRSVKRRLAEAVDPSQKILLDIEQKALKLTANSMYGCLGFEHCRFYAKHLASLVTFKGREILMSTKAMVEQLGYEVVYGDTDSLMIDTKIIDYDEVISRGIAIKEQINRTFRLLEIDIDGVFKPLLLLKKKNYAGASIKKKDDQICRTIEIKGLDTVRRDRAVIAKEAGERVLSMILTGDKDIAQTVEDIHNYLKELGKSIADGTIPREKFLISKQLNRNPEEYRDTKALGHVTLALRYNEDPKNNKKLRAGHTVEYVICLDGKDQSANQRAYTLQELDVSPETLKIDTEYYLCQQIHPVMTRICDKLPITNAYVLAEMLGVEKSNQIHIKREETDSTKRDQLLSKGDSRFHSCAPLVIKCPNCKLPDEIKERKRVFKDKVNELSLTRCLNCNVKYAWNSKQVVAQIIATIRRLTTSLYCGKFICETPDCDYATRNTFGPMENEQPLCPHCNNCLMPEMSDRKMDLQLAFFKHLLDTREDKPSDEAIDLYKSCMREVDYALKCSAINNIDAFTMFSMVCSGR